MSRVPRIASHWARRSRVKALLNLNLRILDEMPWSYSYLIFSSRGAECAQISMLTGFHPVIAQRRGVIPCLDELGQDYKPSILLSSKRSVVFENFQQPVCQRPFTDLPNHLFIFLSMLYLTQAWKVVLVYAF